MDNVVHWKAKMSDSDPRLVGAPLHSRKRPTMRDVAALAGVSLKTVSRVVNREGAVRDDTRHRVEEAIAQLDYHPDDRARSLRTLAQATSTIGLVMVDVTNPFHSGLQRAIEDEASGRGYLLLAASSDEDPTREREIVSAFTQRRVDGLIIVPSGDSQSYLIPEMRVGTPVVFADRAPTDVACDWVASDNVGGARAGVAHLISHGHRRIGFVGDSLEIRTARERFRGYQEELATVGIEPADEWIQTDVRGSEQARLAVLDLLAGANPPTALFTAQNLIAIGATRALHSRGLHRSVALVGFDDFEMSDVLEPGITVVHQAVAEIGSIAATYLFERLQGDVSPPRSKLLVPRIIVRGSGEISPEG